MTITCLSHVGLHNAAVCDNMDEPLLCGERYAKPLHERGKVSIGIIALDAIDDAPCLTGRRVIVHYAFADREGNVRPRCVGRLRAGRDRENDRAQSAIRRLIAETLYES